MLQSFNQTQHFGAMETRDHSINGASLKSQMSKENQSLSVKGADIKQISMNLLKLCTILTLMCFTYEIIIAQDRYSVQDFVPDIKKEKNCDDRFEFNSGGIFSKNSHTIVEKVLKEYDYSAELDKLEPTGGTVSFFVTYTNLSGEKIENEKYVPGAIIPAKPGHPIKLRASWDAAQGQGVWVTGKVCKVKK